MAPHICLKKILNFFARNRIYFHFSNGAWIAVFGVSDSSTSPPACLKEMCVYLSIGNGSVSYEQSNSDIFNIMEQGNYFHTFSIVLSKRSIISVQSHIFHYLMAIFMKKKWGFKFIGGVHKLRNYKHITTFSRPLVNLRNHCFEFARPLPLLPTSDPTLLPVSVTNRNHFLSIFKPFPG